MYRQNLLSKVALLARWAAYLFGKQTQEQSVGVLIKTIERHVATWQNHSQRRDARTTEVEMNRC